jgi:sodium transport system permease protein
MAVTPESIAGEKERGTIATLLVTPIKRYELAVGKIVSITVIALASSLSSFIGTIASLPKMMAGESLNASLKYSVGSYFQILLVILSLVIVIVSVLGCISAFSKSIKEAGSYSTPLMIVAILVGITSMFSSGSSPWYFYLIPLYNGVRCLTDILTFSPNIIGLIIAVLSNFAYAVAFGFLLVKMFNSEKVMFQR